jgi:hypothetical protein
LQREDGAADEEFGGGIASDVGDGAVGGFQSVERVGDGVGLEVGAAEKL